MGPKGLTIPQQKVAEVMVSGEARSLVHAAKIAGVGVNTAQRAMRNPKVVAEIERLKAKRGDIARELEQLAGSRALEAIGTETDPQTLVGSWATARKIRVEHPDTTQDESAAENARLYRRALVWALRIGWYKGYVAACGEHGFDVVQTGVVGSGGSEGEAPGGEEAGYRTDIRDFGKEEDPDSEGDPDPEGPPDPEGAGPDPDPERDGSDNKQPDPEGIGPITPLSPHPDNIPSDTEHL